MPTETPLISVTIPAYNSQATIAQAIQSVLDQTFTDFEIIVVDDGSKDRTGEIVAEFNDPRITYIYQENQGGSQATNRALEAARGKYVALFAADDICCPERLEREYNFLSETGGKIVFSWAEFIGDDGQVLEGNHFARGFFNHPQRDQAEMINWFFFKGNYLCTVSCMAERQLFFDNGLFRPSSAQVPDLWMWGKLVRTIELPILPEKLIKYRVRSDGGNVSGPLNAPRAQFELVEFSRDFLQSLSADMFKKAFARNLRNPYFEEGVEFELEKAFLCIQHQLPGVRQAGVERLSVLFEDLRVVEISRTNYSFGLPELFLVTKSLQISAGLELIKLKEQLLLLQDTESEAKRYVKSLETEIKKLTTYLKSLEPAFENAQKYLKNLEPAYQDSQQRLAHLDLEYRKTSALLEEKAVANSVLQLQNQELASKNLDLTARLEQALTAKEHLEKSLARYEKDLRALQATRTVRITRFLRRPFGK